MKRFVILFLCALLIFQTSGTVDAKTSKRKQITKFATSMKGKIRYGWGSKPSKLYSKGEWPYCLDCSGFVMFVYWQVFKEKNSGLCCTYDITRDQKQISKSQLKPGDIGTIYNEGSAYTVRYKDEDGVVIKKKFYQEGQANSYMNKKKKNVSDRIKELEQMVKDYDAIIDYGTEQISYYKKLLKTYYTYSTLYRLDEFLQSNITAKYDKKTASKSLKKLKKVKKSFAIDRKVNHAGIYCGKKKGKDVWCHCSSSGDGVVVTKGYNRFKCFYRAGYFN